MADASSKPSDSSLWKRPEVLYQASLEHVREAEELRSRRRWSLAIYVAGLAVECVLQAVALRDGATDDARHDLRVWLRKCPSSLQAIIAQQVPDEWTTLNSIWDNRLRYLSEAGLLGYLRRMRRDRGIKGGADSVLKVNAKRTVDAARAVHRKGAALWETYWKK